MATMALETPMTAASARYSTGAVKSKDGTTIGYRQIGRGPGVVLLHGSNESSASHTELAEALADSYTVYLPDRRGRGMSGAYSPHYTVQDDVDDMDALLQATGAEYVFGISSGAVIWLLSMLRLPQIRKAVLYEPPIVVDGSLPTDFVARYDREIAEGKTTAALVTAMLGAQMGPSFFRRIPRPLLQWMTERMTTSQAAKAQPGEVTMRSLAPTLHYDFQLVLESTDKIERFRAIHTDILLLGGSQSASYMKTALDALEKVLPNATRVELSGVGHNASGNSDQWGKPELVAEQMRRFFA